MHKFKKKEYHKDGLTVVWDMPKCIHSERCWRGLGEVFRRKERPWIEPQGADNERIMAQIDQCPSGALSYRSASLKAQKEEESMEITVIKDGPVLMAGTMTIKHSDGSTEQIDGNTAFCRCGASSNKPFCDGTHNSIDFKG